MEEVLTHTQEIMIRFLISLPAPEQLILSQEARSAFLNDPEAVKAHYHVLDQEEEEEWAKENIILIGEAMVIAEKIFKMQKIVISFHCHLCLQETL